MEARKGDIRPQLTLAHDLVDLAVLLAADEFFVLIGELDLHAHLVLTPLHKRDLVDNHHRRLHSVIRAINGEGEIVKAHFSA